MWLLIGANIVSSIVAFCRTVVLLVWYNNSCTFTSVIINYIKDTNKEAGINFIFTIFSYYLGICVTLVILWLRRKDI